MIPSSRKKVKMNSYMLKLPTLMRKKMMAGEVKYGDSWTDSDPDYLYRRMEEEFYEFRQAIEHDDNPEAAIREVADMVNFGLMYMAVVDAENGVKRHE